MEARLVIFIGLAAAELIFNAVVIAMIYVTFSKMTAKVSEGMNEFQNSAAPRKMLARLQSSSEEAAKVTGVVREQIVGFEPKLERMQSAYAESLSKVDVRLKLACRAIHFSAEQIEKVVKWPVRNIHATAAAVQGIISFIRGSENGADARSRRTR